MRSADKSFQVSSVLRVVIPFCCLIGWLSFVPLSHAEELKPINLVRHVRFPGGLSFSSVQPKQDPTARLLGFVNEEGGKSFEKYLEAVEREIEKLKNPDPLPRCAASREEKVTFELPEEAPYEVIIEDFLFLAEDPPLDAESRFGESAMIHLLNEKGDPSLRGFADAMGVDCLPYRLRTTTRAIYRFEGETALKRYEEILGEGDKK
jgi:hypothetical protein